MTTIHFLLNDTEIREELDGGSCYGGLALLDYIRRRRGLKGTKEGCKEGDCGACTVLLGELDGTSMRYRPVTSCLVPLAEADGRQVVTIEGLDVGAPNTIQREIVAAGASQCGFCTPGIAVSFMGRLMDGTSPADEAAGGSVTAEVDRTLSGHLCRCTGYRSLRDAGAVTFRTLAEAQGVQALVARGELPSWFDDVPRRLRELELGATSDARSGAFVAGGTDLYVQRGEELPDEPVTALNTWLRERPALRGVRRDGDALCIGALTTFEGLAASRLLRQQIPRIRTFLDLVASWQIRTRSTVGGNLINASPIGDVTILLLALGGTAVFEDRDAEGLRREVALKDLYLGYKQLDRRPSEVLVEVRVPDLGSGDHVDFQKVSKRRMLDIATVNSASRLRAEDEVIVEASFAAGGVAPVPLYLARTSEVVAGRPVELATLELALRTAQQEIAPISDVRGSADYKRLLVRNLLVAHFVESFPERMDLDTTFDALCA